MYFTEKTSQIGSDRFLLTAVRRKKQKTERGEHRDTACSPYSVLLGFRVLHRVSAMASMTTTKPPLRVAAILIAILAAFRSSIVVLWRRTA
jgi:hypothetical protein